MILSPGPPEDEEAYAIDLIQRDDDGVWVASIEGFEDTLLAHGDDEDSAVKALCALLNREWPPNQTVQ